MVRRGGAADGGDSCFAPSRTTETLQHQRWSAFSKICATCFILRARTVSRKWPEAKKNGDLDRKNGDRDSKNAREMIIPVFLAPKMKSKNNKVDHGNKVCHVHFQLSGNISIDEIWNKRQIIYGIALLGPLGLVLAVAAILP
ncbi:hypothetical protein EJB05_15178, partial [Eragrostis curvula]